MSHEVSGRLGRCPSCRISPPAACPRPPAGTSGGFSKGIIPIRKWVYAIYLDVTSLKGVSSMKLHRDIGVCPNTAWFMQQRIREAFRAEGPRVFAGPVEGGRGGLRRAAQRGDGTGNDGARSGTGPGVGPRHPERSV